MPTLRDLRSRLTVLFALTCALVVLAPVAAHAATLEVVDGTLTYEADPGKVNVVTFTEIAPNTVRVTRETGQGDDDSIEPDGTTCTADVVATGTATTTAGSNTLTAVTGGPFTVGLEITGTGIPDGTTITAVGPNTLTISNTATASGTVTITGLSEEDFTCTGVEDVEADALDKDDSLSAVGLDDIPSHLNGGDGNDQLFGGDSHSDLDGEAGDDQLFGGDSGDGLDGGSGDDRIYADSSGVSDAIAAGNLVAAAIGPIAMSGGGSDTIEGGAGNDEIFAGDEDDIIDGGDGDDLISGGGGNDNIKGGAGVDNIAGDEGNDSIDGGDAGDTISGGDGNDDIDGGAGADDIAGGQGDDDLSGGDAGDEISGDGGNDKITGGEGGDSLSGGDGNDKLDGGQGADDIAGGDGNDTIDAGQAEDDIAGGDGNDDIDGGDNNDKISGGDGNDDIDGGQGEDSIGAGSGDDVIDGGDGNDAIGGDGGNDRLFGDDGDDQLSGGDGDDFFNGGTGADTIAGGAGVNVVDYSDSPTRVTVDLAGGPDTCGGSNACGGAGTDTIFGVQNVVGSPFNDTLIGNDLNNVLDAGAGNDVLNGGFGDDIENGGEGNDRFDQGDVLNGNDVLNGGPGIDLADYHARELQVSVTLDGIANDGQPLEFDNVMPDVENSLRPPPPVFPLPTPAPDLTAPSLTHFEVSGEHISPNNDGRDDVLRIIARFSEETNWKFEVLSGSTVLFSTAGQGTVLRTGWRGLTGIGTQAVSGKYGWRLTGTDAAGNQLRPKTGIVFVDRRTPRVRSLRVSRTGRVNRIRFTVSEPAVVAARVVGVRRLGTVRLDDPGSVTLSFNGRTRSGRLVRPGFYRVVIVVSDLAGNQVVKRVTIRVTR